MTIVYYFIKSRLETGCKDFLTVILYNDTAEKVIDRQRLSSTDDVESLIKRLISYVYCQLCFHLQCRIFALCLRNTNVCFELELYYTDAGPPDGDTHFGNAMQLAEASVTYFEEQTAIIFLTDGQATNAKASNDNLDKDADRDNVIASERLTRLDSKCSSFNFYPIKFGTGTWTKWVLGEALDKMAKAANTNVINVGTGKDDSKKTEKALETVNLTQHLQIIAQKIGDTSLLVFKEQEE